MAVNDVVWIGGKPQVVQSYGEAATVVWMGGCPVVVHELTPLSPPEPPVDPTTMIRVTAMSIREQVSHTLAATNYAAHYLTASEHADHTFTVEGSP